MYPGAGFPAPRALSAHFACPSLAGLISPVSPRALPLQYTFYLSTLPLSPLLPCLYSSTSLFLLSGARVDACRHIRDINTTQG